MGFLQLEQCDGIISLLPKTEQRLLNLSYYVPDLQAPGN
jgi:hypothetical protein